MFKKILTNVRKFFCLNARDIGMQVYTQDEIEKMMKEKHKINYPHKFAATLRKIMDYENKNCKI